MQYKLVVKLLVVAGLSFVLLVPLSMIEHQIYARSARQNEVIRNIAESAAGAQTLVGPVLAVRYRERVEQEGSKPGDVRHAIVEDTIVLPPPLLDIEGGARVETRSRGLYRARLFHLGLQVSGKAAVPPRLGLDRGREILGAQAFLVMGISDPRGVDNDPVVLVNGKTHRLATGTAGALEGHGVHVPLGEIDVASGHSFEFSLPLELTGSERLAIAPAGSATTVRLKSDWPHPSFQGRFLPTARTVAADGFEARWQVSHLARNFERVLDSAKATTAVTETLGISFMEPVNVYLKSERAVKYGILFVALTFASFFLTEVLRRLRIHPFQYLLVGLALALFFLLLIALSEHLAFGWSYGISALACVALIGTYLSGVLGSRVAGFAFGGGIAGLYGVLYGVLLSEDNALLMGALLLFGALGAIMVATRRIDWYRIGGEVAGEGH